MRAESARTARRVFLARHLPSAAIRWVARSWPDPSPEAVAAITGLEESRWTEMSGLFPLLGSCPGRDAARQRRSLGLLAGNALSRNSRRIVWRPGRPDPDPALYFTIHLGNVRLLRYFLRLAGIAVATIVDATHLADPRVRAQNAWIDRRRPIAFPHVVFAGEVHRLRSALRRGSLMAAVDRIHRPMPGKGGEDRVVPFLGGRLTLDLSALRLARIARVPVRPIFLTLPGERLTITVGDPLPADADRAGERFGALADAAARASPADFDAYTHRFLLRDPPP